MCPLSLRDVRTELDVAAEHLQSADADLHELLGSDPSAHLSSTQSTSKLPFHEHYRIFRTYIEHEDTLVNNRLLWNIYIQGFLFAAYGFSLQKLAEVQAQSQAEAIIGTGTEALRWFIIIIPIFGGLIGYFSWKGVKAAQQAILRLKVEWESIPRPTDAPKLPGVTGGGDEGNHIAGFLAPNIFPWLFVVTWTLLLFGYLGPWLWLRFGKP